MIVTLVDLFRSERCLVDSLQLDHKDCDGVEEQRGVVSGLLRNKFFF